jgi:LmbE family N-acetylglucosaminyl deacetylase
MTEARSGGLSSFMEGVRTVLHLSPHPDDEVVGAGATLLALRDTGHRVVNLAVTLGSDERERARRLREVETACGRAGFELVVHDPQRDLAAAVRALIAEHGVDLVVAPSPHDGHPRHEAVGRAARDAVEGGRGADPPPRLWLWGLWADLPRPTLYHGFDEALMRQATYVLEAHAGELERNDYRGFLRARATANGVLGAERVFGWGAPGRGQPFAELLMEAVVGDDGWRATAARALDPARALEDPPEPAANIGWWLHEPSFTDRTRGPNPTRESAAPRGA